MVPTPLEYSCWSRHRTATAVSAFAIFTSIVMIIGVLIVCFTSPKRTSETCQHMFRRTMKSSIIYNSQPRSVAIGDFNNDNKIDIVVANSGTNTIGIFLSNDNGTFINQQTYLTGYQSRPYSIIVNDFNNDHYQDIAVANYGNNNIGIFLGYSNGTFHDQRIFSLGSSHPLFITTNDFNNDNKMDIAVVNYGTNNIGILLGNGDGSFQNQITYFIAYDSIPYSLAIGDFNKDNQLDIAVVNYGTNNIVILLGYGNGRFENKNIYTTDINSNPSSIVVGDFNNDNHLDIIVANNGNGNIGIFLGYGNGTFTEQLTFSISSNSHPQYITVGNFNKDNRFYVVVVDSENDQIHFLSEYDNGAFTKVTTYDGISKSNPFSIAIADFNKDNQSDIVVANYATNNILILSGYFSIPSTRQTNYFVGQNTRPNCVAIADINNDGQLDLIVSNHDNNVLIFTGYGNGTFSKNMAYSTGENSLPHYVVVIDLNNDNRMDIVTANYGSNTIGVLLGQDNGTFANVTTYSTGINSLPWSVAVGDLNGDNILDIVSGNWGFTYVSVFLGLGNGIFGNTTTYFTGYDSNPISVVVGDVNNDNRLDIITANHHSDNVGILIGYGNGSFNDVTTYSVGLYTYPTYVALADFNRDNQLDILVATLQGSFVGVLLGHRNGTFEKVTTYSTGSTSSLYSIAIADFNNDNQYDFIVTDIGNNVVIIFYGYGNGSFQLARTYSTGFGSNPYSVTTVKLKNKNETDIVVTLWGNGNVAILTEYYAAEFVNQSAYTTDSAPQPYSVTVGNFNNDNKVDIAIVNSGTDNLDVLFGSSNGTFETETIYYIGENFHPQYIISDDINKDNHLDIVTANSKNDSISVIMGYGNGTFAPQMIYSTGTDSYPYAVAISDMNNDNRLDLIIANSGTNNIGILFGFNYTSFRRQTTYSSEDSLGPWGIITDDFNNDNYLDIAATFFNSNNIGVLLGYGNGSFGIVIIHPTGNGSAPQSLAAYDFNNDGVLDIVVANYGTNNIVSLLGYGNGSFATIGTYSTGQNSRPYAVIIIDINDDGRMDIIVANYGTSNIGILFGCGNFNFTTMVTYSTGNNSGPDSIVVSDFNNDGSLDIAVANYFTSNIGIFIGLGNGSFKSEVIYSSGDLSFPVWITVGDFNNDSRIDIATANYNMNNVGIFLGCGNETFAPVVTYSTGDGSTPVFVDVHDFNKDNILDIAVVNSGTSNVVVLFGFGDGSFLLGIAYSTGTGSTSQGLVIDDFDNDTRLDIAVSNYMTNNIGIFLGYDNEPFAGVMTYSTGTRSQPYSIAIDDLNNDGWLDIIVANYGTNNVGVLLGRSNRFFDPIMTYSTGVGSAPYSVATGDFNSDNQSDIVVSNSETDNILIFLGYGNGSFEIGLTYSTGVLSRPYTVAIADLNNDNILDIAIANSGTNNIFLLYGYGNGNFGNESSYTLNYGYRPYSIALKDLNQDGWIDIVIACYGTNHVETLIKMC
ncbi:unnamed protein product [Rotaria sp. Silwood1]|nr:unnamed protein product [Rotaria sp. Silwood1]CAF4757001.1 unnamed protein product [Rotaria sp. Silwood1]